MIAKIRLPNRLAFAAVVALIIAAMAMGMYLQYVVDLEPCPLCVLQRLGYVVTGLLALPGTVFALGARAQRLLAGLALLTAVAGGAVATWHAYLVVYPPASMTCGRPFQWFDDDFPLVLWLPKLFRGQGDCLRVDWTLLGLNIPQWALLVFVAISVLLAGIVFGRRRVAD